MEIPPLNWSSHEVPSTGAWLPRRHWQWWLLRDAFRSHQSHLHILETRCWQFMWILQICPIPLMIFCLFDALNLICTCIIRYIRKYPISFTKLNCLINHIQRIYLHCFTCNYVLLGYVVKIGWNRHDLNQIYKKHSFSHRHFGSRLANFLFGFTLIDPWNYK